MTTKEPQAPLDALRARGLLYQHTDGLAEHLARGPVSVYCGFDPTAPSLHVGNLVPVMALARLAQMGHRMIAVVGGGTAMIGDPGGKSVERPLLSAAEVAANSEAIAGQLRRIVGDNLTVVDNAEWLAPLRAIDFLRDVGKHFPVNLMLAKDTVKARLETGISFTEFSYMLLQAYDYLQLYTRYNVTLQVGGSDQWGNITAGTELIRRAVGGDAHALTTPLLTTASGKKFGKSEAGAVWLDKSRTSVFDFFQYWLNVDDADVVPLLWIFGSVTSEEVAQAEASLRDEPQKRAAHRLLATRMTALVHSRALAESAVRASDVMFAPDADYAAADDDVLELLNEAAGRPCIAVAAGDTSVGVAELASAALAISKSEARRLLAQRGLSVNGERAAPDVTHIELARAIRGRWFVVKRGSQKIGVLRLTTAYSV